MELGTGSQHLTTHHNHPEGWFKPESLIYSIWNRTWKLAFIPHSQVMLMLLIIGPCSNKYVVSVGVYFILSLIPWESWDREQS